MPERIILSAPQASDDNQHYRLERWLKKVGDDIKKNEPVVEILDARDARIVIDSPVDGQLSEQDIAESYRLTPGQKIGAIVVVEKNDMQWETFDELADLLENHTDKVRSARELKDTNEALAQLLGVADKAVFQNMTIEQQNKFLQGVTDQHKAYGLGPAQVAQKLLEGLQLRPPQLAPPTPAPVFGFAPSAPGMSGPGGMGGGGGMRPSPPQPASKSDNKS